MHGTGPRPRDRRKRFHFDVHWTVVGASARLPAAPLDEELLVLELGEIGAQRAHEAARLGRRGVPEERDLARGDLDDLHVIGLAGTAQQRGPAPGPADDQLIRPVGLHASAPAAFSSSRSPWKMRSPIWTAGVSTTPAAAAAAVASA